jgi:transketolase
MRVLSVESTTVAGSGHPTSALSAADIVATLFFHVMKYDPKNPQNPNNDRFILSKGHASPILYSAWEQAGAISRDELMTLRKFDSVIEGHPTPRFKYVDVATGSLGQGLSMGNGMCLSARLDKRDFRTYVLMGDSEVSEGSVWEACEIAAHYKLDNLTGIVDVNRLGQTGPTMEGYDVEDYARKFSAFGWHTIIINGHEIPEIISAFKQAHATKGKPSMIIAKTVKGYGIPSVADKNGFHGKAFSKEELPEVLDEMKKFFSGISNYQDEQWKPNLPAATAVVKKVNHSIKQPQYKKGDKIATRVAFGEALAALGSVHPAVVSLDAEVKNSTFAQTFEKAHAERFFQCFVAEQNMVSMGVGFSAQHKVPFVSTFSAFFTRAFDQLRMAGISRAHMCCVGSHAGVSIGQDGPSQMGLEDVAMFRALPDSVVLYPSDAVSTWKLVEKMSEYHGISYLRTTRSQTPVIYDNDEEFSIGGCKVVRQHHEGNDACIVTAGITLVDALKAYEFLKLEKINVAVVDLYSIKPLAHETLASLARASNNRIITVEDHYLEGGLGQAVTYALRNHNVHIDCLAVTKLPRSGTAAELFAYEDIDMAAIVKAVKKVIK